MGRRGLSIAAALGAIIATGRPAAAQSGAPQDGPAGGGNPVAPSTAPAPTPPGSPTWYGYQILIIDAVAVAGAFWASSSEQYGVGFGTSATVFALGGGVVHLMHNHPVRGAVSVGIRTVGPIVCTVVGGVMAQAAAGPQNNDEFPAWFGGAALGLSLGILGAIIVDDVALAWDEPSPADAPRATSPSLPPLGPSISWSRNREHGEQGTVGVVGAF